MADETVDVVVVGAGFAGIYMVHWLREAGFSVKGFEAGSDVGGTWYWNRYPGARCDSESMWYSYSFLEDVEQEWPQTEKYPGQPDVLRYLNHVADRLDVRTSFVFDTRVVSVAYDDDDRLWDVQVEDGTRQTCRYVITAVGGLSQPNDPHIEGQDEFAGQLLFTSRWPHDPVDFKAKRVGVVGTGSSGIQLIPVVADQAAHLTVFQRTPQFMLPAANEPLSDDLVRQWKENYREWRRLGRNSRSGAPAPVPHLSALDVTPHERRALFEASWEQGGYVFLFGTFTDLMTSEEANEAAADFVRSKIDQIVDDPETAELLKPTSYPIGSKRIPLDTNYYATFNRANVSLVDLKREPIERIARRGVQTTARLHELDILVYATGFDALTGTLLAMDMRGRGGRELRELWAERPITYLGLSIPGFPNLFTITGPGSPSVLGTVPVTIEQNVEFIGELIRWARDRGIDEIEPEASAAAAWTSHVQELADQTLFPRAASWYTGGNIPGKNRVFLPYLGGYNGFRDKCDEVAAADYEGFALRSRSDVAAPS